MIVAHWGTVSEVEVPVGPVTAIVVVALDTMHDVGVSMMTVPELVPLGETVVVVVPFPVHDSVVVT